MCIGNEASSGAGRALLHIAQKGARGSKGKLKRIIKDVRSPYKGKFVKVGMLVFAKEEMRGSGQDIRGT